VYRPAKTRPKPAGSAIMVRITLRSIDEPPPRSADEVCLV
jgi:hypothetical protein